MRARFASSIVLSSVLAASAAFASMTGGSSPAPPPEPSRTPPASTDTLSDSDNSSGHQKAAGFYAQAYELLTKAKTDAEAGKDKNAQKKFKQAAESAQSAVNLDPQYFEAWNLLGFASRKLGNYDAAFAAYDKCLGVKTDYAPAREYLGEAWLEKGDPAKARTQLALLEHYNATAEATMLRDKITAYEAAHPEASAQKTAGASGQ